MTGCPSSSDISGCTTGGPTPTLACGSDPVTRTLGAWHITTGSADVSAMPGEAVQASPSASLRTVSGPSAVQAGTRAQTDGPPGVLVVSERRSSR